MKKILVLGKSGFIGRNVVEYFSEKYDVMTPSHQELDVLDERVLFQYLSKGNFDIVINALDVRDASNNYFEQRIRMFINLTAHHDLYGKMVYFGSGAEFGKHRDIIKVSEENFGEIIPTDMYGLCMYTMQNLASQLPNVYNFRLFGIFGKYEIWQQRFISNAICKALYNYPISIRQNVKFDYLYIDDLCEMIAYFIENEMQYQHYNATSGEVYTLYELAELIRSTTNLAQPIFVTKEGVGREYTSENHRIINESKIHIQKMEQSIKDLFEWYHLNRNRICFTDLIY